MRSSPSLVCLLPVRNGADDLPGYLACAAEFADAVVALDDGSTDDTREVLAASPHVQALLTNPPREGFQQWDDAANRKRLLDAAAQLRPTWILSLDVDERLDTGDAAALRRFIETEAIPGLAFGFRVFQMREGGHYDAKGFWVYRLFAFEPGQSFGGQRLHFHPIPISIPRPCWIRTTLRIQHLAGVTPERRAARVDKYREADPDWAFGHAYPDVAEEAGDVRRWEPRPDGLPVLAAAGDDAGEAPERETPALSAIVISRDDEKRIVRSVASVVGQESPWPFEVIVVTSGSDRTAEIVRREFPQVTLVELPRPALPGEARNAGLRLARGDYVSFPGSHVELPPGSLAARIDAHDLGYAMVTGTTLNGTKTRAGWASYFLDHSAVLPGRPSTGLSGPPAHCSYLRSALLEVGGFPEDMRTGEDTVVNRKLASRGYEAYRAQDVRLIHHNRCRTTWQLARRHFGRGRGFGRILLDRHRTRGRLLRTHGPRSLFRLQVLHRVAGTSGQVEAWGDDETRRTYGRVRRLVIAGTVSHWLGTWYELLRPRRGKVFVLCGRPVLTLAVTGCATALARVDLVARRAKIVSLPEGAIPNGSGRDELGEALRRSLDVEVDGHVRVDEPSRLAGLPFARLRADTSVGALERLSLAWGRRRIRRDDVHVIVLADALASTDPAAPGDRSNLVVKRCLDTRSRRERVPFVSATVQATAAIQDGQGNGSGRSAPVTPARKRPVRFGGRQVSGWEVASVCWKAGWRRRKELVTAVAIARAESYWYERAWNRNDSAELLDRGLFQINEEMWSTVSEEDAFDAGRNAQYAFAIYRNAGRRFSDWVTYQTGSYRHHLPAAADVVRRFLADERWSYSDADVEEPCLGDAVQHEIDALREPVP
jgi:glycosyltransferase involved in cell wall biosynthesis